MGRRYIPATTDLTYLDENAKDIMVATLPGVRVGSSCTVEIEGREFGEIQSYASRIEDLEEDRLFVDWPTKKGQQVEVANGEHVHVAVPTPAAQHFSWTRRSCGACRIRRAIR
jgi:hypothetical protein